MVARRLSWSQGGRMSIYARGAEAYLRAGWRGILPLPPGKKWKPPHGWTGYGAPDPTEREVRQWIGEDFGLGLNQNLALRMSALPNGLDIVGIDVDSYKGGDSTLKRLEVELGPLGRTWSNSARFDEDDIGGHWFYRTPHIPNYKGELGPGIDVLNHHHRYSVAWPSTNPDADGRVYRWRDPLGVIVPEGTVPDPTAFPMLPDPWRQYVTASHARVQSKALSYREANQWMGSCRVPDPEHPQCGIVKRGLEKALRDLADPRGPGRHATARDWTRAIVGYGGEGHVGAIDALEEFRDAFVAALATPGPGRVVDPDEALYEFDSMAEGAVRIAAAQNATPRIGCDCPTFEGLSEFRPLGAAVDPAAGSGPADDPAPPLVLTETPGDPDPMTPGGTAIADMPTVEGLRKAPGDWGQTVDDMAMCYVDWFVDDVKFVPSGGVGWLVRDGSTWRQDIEGRARELARRLYRMIPEGKEWKAFRGGMLHPAGVSAALNLAATDDRVVTPLDALDRNPLVLNTPSGVVDLRTGELRKARAGEILTRVTAVAPDVDRGRVRPSADGVARWLAYLDRVFAGDQELIQYVQRVCGWAICGHSREHVLPFLFGEGRNGKNVLVDVLAGVMSVDQATGYAHNAGANFLMVKQHEGHPTELASLMGRRVVVCSEVRKGAKFDEERVKSLTGNRWVTARFMRANEITFPARHTMFLLGNDYPEVTAGGPSFWERVRIIPFNVYIPPEERDKTLTDRLIDKDGSAVLAWFIEGAVAYNGQGLDPTPAAVKAATEEYADDQNHLARFIEDRLVIGGGEACKVETSVMFAEYEQWCRANRVRSDVMHKSNWLSRAIKSESGLTTEPNNSKRFYTNVSLSVSIGGNSE